MASTYVTFCNNRDCKKVDCLRYYNNAPFDKLLSWFHVTPTDDKCKYYIKNK